MRCFVILLLLLLGLATWAESVVPRSVPFQVDGRDLGQQPVLLVDGQVFFQQTSLEQLTKAVIKPAGRGATINGKPIQNVRTHNADLYLAADEVTGAMGWHAEVVNGTVVMATKPSPTAIATVLLNLVRKTREPSPQPNFDTWSLAVVVANRGNQPLKFNLNQFTLADSNRRPHPCSTNGDVELKPGQSQTINNLLFNCPSRTTIKYVILMGEDRKTMLANVAF